MMMLMLIRKLRISYQKLNCAAENTQIWVFLAGLCSLELYLINPQADDRDADCDENMIKDYSGDYSRWASAILQDLP